MLTVTLSETRSIPARNGDAGRCAGDLFVGTESDDRENGGEEDERGRSSGHDVLLSHVGRGIDERLRDDGSLHGEGDEDPRAAVSRTRAARDAAAVQFDDLSAHVEADSRAAWRRAPIGVMMFEPKELVEDPRAERVGHARTGVNDADIYRRRSSSVREQCLTLDGHAPTFWRVLQGVRKNVVEDRSQSQCIR